MITTLRTRRSLAIGLLVLAAAFLWPGVASAHANLVQSSPASGSRVEVLPGRLRMEFTEGVVSLEVRVTDQAGQHYEVGRGAADPSDQRVQTVALRSGANGIYTVTWLALSVDGHTTDGSYFFLVGDAVPDRATILAQAASVAARADSNANPTEVVVRALLFLALSTLVGLPLAVLTLARDAVADDRLWRRIRGAVVVAGLVLAISAALLTAVQFLASLHHFTLAPLPQFLQGTQGTAGTVRVLIGLLAVGVAFRATSRLTGLALILAAGLAAEVTVSLGSHSHALLGDAPAVLSDLGHLVGAATWGGGLLLLAVILPGVSGDNAEAQRLVAAAGRRFGRVAIAGVGLVVTTGLLLASWHLGGWAQLTATVYGNAAVAKVGLLLVAIALGAWHRLRLVDALAGGGARARRAFTASVRVEAAAVALILALSALMTSSETGTAAATAGRHPIAQLTQQSRDVTLDLTVTPMATGFNVFDVDLRRGASPATQLASPILLLRLPSAGIELDPMPLQPLPGGGYSSVAALPQPGAWEARVSGDLDSGFLAGTFALPEVRSEATGYLSEPQFARVARVAAALVALAASAGIAAESALRRPGEPPHREAHRKAR